MTAKVYGVLPHTVSGPSKPVGLVEGDITGSTIELTWSDVGDATSWTIYLGGVPTGSPVIAAGALIVGLAQLTGYDVQVQAHNNIGSSPLSDVLIVSTIANSPPIWLIDPNQDGVIGTAVNIDLDAESEDIDLNTRTYSIVSGSVPGLALGSNQKTYVGTPTTAGPFSVTLRVSDGLGFSDITLDWTVSDPDVIAPTAPVLGQATVNGSTVSVPLATASTDASGILNYEIERAPPSLVYSLRGTIAPSSFPFVESGVPLGTWNYRARARDNSANGNFSSFSNVTQVVVSATQPDIPINFAASPSDQRIDLSWAPGPSGATPTDYELEFSTVGPSGPWTNLPIGLVTTFAHTSLTNGQTYYYRLRAFTGVLPSDGYATVSAIAGEFPLFTIYSAFITARGGTPIPLSNTRYWDKPVYPTSGTIYPSVAAAVTASASAAPGTVIRVANGTYSNQDFIISRDDITFCAETRGGVNLTNTSQITITGDRTTALGFNFTGPINNSSPIISLQCDDAVVGYIGCTAKRTSSLTAGRVIESQGARNRVCYWTCDGFNGNGSFLRAQGGTSRRYNRLDHNHVLNMLNTATSTIDNEVLQMGQNDTGTAYYGLADNNYIYRWNNDNGAPSVNVEAETLSFKSDSNLCIQNVMVECKSHITLRHGRFCAIYGNYWIANSYVDSGGMRIHGAGHLIACNYLENGNPNGNNFRAAIVIQGGNLSAVPPTATGRYPAVDCQYAFNTTFNFRAPVRFQTTTTETNIPPENNAFYNNAFDKHPSGDCFQTVNNPQDINTTFHSDTAEPTVGRTASGLTAAVPGLSLVNGVRVPTGGGNLENTGQTGYSSLIICDILGNPIPGAGSINRGCFQANPAANPWHAIRDAAGQSA